MAIAPVLLYDQWAMTRVRSELCSCLAGIEFDCGILCTQPGPPLGAICGDLTGAAALSHNQAMLV